MPVFVVINEESFMEYEFDNIQDARQTLVSLVECGVKSSLLVDNKYQNFRFNQLFNYFDVLNNEVNKQSYGKDNHRNQ